MYKLFMPVFFILCCLCFVAACEGDSGNPSQTDGDLDDDVEPLDGDDEAAGEWDEEAEAETEKETVHLSAAAGCAHLIDAVCMYPYPSMAHLKQDEGSSTGKRVALTSEMLPFESSSPEGLEYFLGRFNAADGFSLATPILAIFPDVHVDESSLPSLRDLAAGVKADSPVQIIDRENGERLPVWAEMDNYAREAEGGAWLDDQRSMIIRPQAALKWGHRYAVVITDAVKDDEGKALPIPPAMQALLDRAPTDSEQIESLRSDYRDLFGFLKDQGVARSSIVLTWEFVTMSREFAESPLLATLGEARGKAAEAEFDYEITNCTAADQQDRDNLACKENADLHESIWRRFDGHVLTPSFLTEEGTINWGNGSPAFQNMEKTVFSAMLPDSVRQASAASLPSMFVGHGLMSKASLYLMVDRDDNGTMEMTDKLGMFAIGADFKGLAMSGLASIVSMLQNFDRMWMLHDNLIQGMVDYDLMTDFVNKALKDDPLLADDEGLSLIDTQRSYYFGISLGAIAGAVSIALSEDLDTAVLHVPSAMFSSLLQHSSEFADFQMMLDIFLPGPVQQQIVLALVQRALDPIDPINWRERFFESPVEGVAVKNMLWQVSYYDANAPDYGAYTLQRSTGIPLVLPTTHDVYGVTAGIEAPTAPGSSGLVIYDAGKEEPSYNNAEVIDNGAHHALRCNEEIHSQVADYFAKEAEGSIVMHCDDGPCFVEGIDCRTSLSK